MSARVIELFGDIDPDADMLEAGAIVLAEARSARERHGHAPDATSPAPIVLGAIVSGLIAEAGTARRAPLRFAARSAWDAWYRVLQPPALEQLGALDAARVVARQPSPLQGGRVAGGRRTDPSSPAAARRVVEVLGAHLSPRAARRAGNVVRIAESSRAVSSETRTVAERASCAPRAAPSGARGPALMYIASLAPGSRPTMEGAMRDIARFFGSDRPADFSWHLLRYTDAHALRESLLERYAAATVNRYLACLRGILRECFRLGVIDDTDYRRAVDVDGVTAETAPAGRALELEEMQRLFASCDLLTPLGARDAAMLALLYGCGLRRSEVVALDVDDVDGSIVRVRRAKGNKDRTAYLPAGGVRAVRAWLRVRGTAPGALLYPTCGGKITARSLRPRRMCKDNVRNALRALAKRSGVSHFTPHDLRRSFVGNLLDTGADLVTVQKLSGHADPRTTSAYDRRPERARALAAERLRVPYAEDNAPGGCVPRGAIECDPPRRGAP